MASWRCWFLFQNSFSEFPTLNSFLGKFGPKKSKLSSLAEKWHIECLDIVNSYSDIIFLSFDPKSFFGQIWAETFKVVHFDWKLANRVSRRFWFLFRHYCSQFLTLNPFLNKFGQKNSKLFILTKNWDTWYIEDADCYSDNSFLNCQP